MEGSCDARVSKEREREDESKGPIKRIVNAWTWQKKKNINKENIV